MMIKGIVSAIRGSSADLPTQLSYAITRSTIEGLEAFYSYISKHGVVSEALIIICNGWVDAILNNQFVIVGAFTNDSGEGSKGYASVVNALWDIECSSIREVRCNLAMHSRLRSASLTYEDIEYMSGPVVEISHDWQRLLGTTRLHTWKPAHTINQFTLHDALREIVAGHDDLRDVIFTAYRLLEHTSRQKTGRPKDNLAAWQIGDKKPTDWAKSDYILKAVGAFRNERGHEPQSYAPSALELLLLDYAFKLHDDKDGEL